MKKQLPWLWLLLTLPLALGGCEKATTDTADVSVNIRVTPDPPEVGSITVVVTLHDDEGKAMGGATVDLEATMTHAGMTPVFARATEVDPGLYQAELELTMGGDWIIIVRAELADGRSLERDFDLPGVRTPERD